MFEEMGNTEGKKQVSAREARVLHEWGAGLEAFCNALVWRNSRERHIYQVQIRAPVRAQGDWLLLVKAVGEEGPEIAFHTAESSLQAITTFGSRTAAGKVKWQLDDFPPNKYEEIAAFVSSELQYKADHDWD